MANQYFLGGQMTAGIIDHHCTDKIWKTYMFRCRNLSGNFFPGIMSLREQINYPLLPAAACVFWIQFTHVGQQCDWVFSSIPWSPFFIPNQYVKDRTEQCGSMGHLFTDRGRDGKLPPAPKILCVNSYKRASVCVSKYVTCCYEHSRHFFSINVFQESPDCFWIAARLTCNGETSAHIFRHAVLTWAISGLPVVS